MKFDQLEFDLTRKAEACLDSDFAPLSLKVKRPTLRGVQVLRALAACMVVVLHADSLWSSQVGNGHSPAVWLNGAAGVDIFFVISGLVMALSTIGKEHVTHPALSFLERRIIRLVPLYWIVTMATLLQIEITRWHEHFAYNTHLVRTPVSYVVSSLFFLPYLNSLGNIQPLLTTGWTLSFEMFFYLLFAVALSLRTGVVRVLTPMMIILVIAGTFHQTNWPTSTVLLSPLLLEFLAGLLIGHLVLAGFHMNEIISAFLGLASLGVILFLPLSTWPSMRVLQWGIPAALLVLSVVAIEDRFGGAWPQWALLLGDASYSIYLVHLLVFWSLWRTLAKFHVLTAGIIRRQDEIVTILFLLGCSIVISLLLYRLVEEPMTNKLRRVMRATASFTSMQRNNTR